MSIRETFEHELSDMKKHLVEMCRLTETMIDIAIRALIERDREKGKSLIAMDKKVDEYEMDIEKQCIRILLRQQPVAKDFREVSAALKMITDIERIGDQASDIGELVYSMPGDEYIGKLANIERMGKIAVEMVRESVHSYISDNEAIADKVIAMDDEMDDLFVKVKTNLISLIQKDSNNGNQAIGLMMVAKYLEKIGDHAVNVAEWTKYNETGVHEKY